MNKIIKTLSIIAALSVALPAIAIVPYMRYYEPAYWYCEAWEWDVAHAYTEVAAIAEESRPADCYAVMTLFNYNHDGCSYSFVVSYYHPYYNALGRLTATRYEAGLKGCIYYVQTKDKAWRGWIHGSVRI